MILLSIESDSKTTIEKAARVLLMENLAINLNIREGTERIRIVNGSLQHAPVYELTARTKALLFSFIDERLQKEFADEMPELYSVPLVNINQEQGRQLIVKVNQV